MEKEYTLNKQEFLAKEFFWYAVITFFEGGEFNPINWTMWNNFFMIIMFVLFQLYVLGTCLIEKEEENGN